jgi:hypothetical protein
MHLIETKDLKFAKTSKRAWTRPTNRRRHQPLPCQLRLIYQFVRHTFFFTSQSSAVLGSLSVSRLNISILMPPDKSPESTAVGTFGFGSAVSHQVPAVARLYML